MTMETLSIDYDYKPRPPYLQSLRIIQAPTIERLEVLANDFMHANAHGLADGSVYILGGVERYGNELFCLTFVVIEENRPS